MPAAIASVSAPELSQRLRGADPPMLLDCREPSEWAVCRIDGATLIPMRETKDRLDELDRAREIVVYCHHGVRSRKVAEFLAAQGFARVASLDGGIDAWSVAVDPAVPRY